MSDKIGIVIFARACVFESLPAKSANGSITLHGNKAKISNKSAIERSAHLGYLLGKFHQGTATLDSDCQTALPSGAKDAARLPFPSIAAGVSTEGRNGCFSHVQVKSRLASASKSMPSDAAFVAAVANLPTRGRGAELVQCSVGC